MEEQVITSPLKLRVYAEPICILHFEFKFPAKNSEFFRLKYLNFPPNFLDSIVVVVGVVAAAYGDNRGTYLFIWAFSVKPIIIIIIM